MCTVNGMLLAIGGKEDTNKPSMSINEFYHSDQTWKHVGDMPVECSVVDALLLSGGGLLVVDGYNRQVLKIEIEPSPKKLGIDEKYVNMWEE